MPGSRFFHPHDEITRQMGVRLIGVDRPGYGDSTFQPGRRILDWPKDILELADALGLDRFAVAGHSGGGPYTLACAYALPERVSAAAPICGAGPCETPHGSDGMDFLSKMGFQYGRYIPWTLWRTVVWLAYRKKLHPTAGTLTRKKSRRPPADEEQMDFLEVRETCIASEQEGFRPGLDGFAWDARLITRPWEFHLEEIRVPVLLWHGTADNITPVCMAEHVAARLPNCRITLCRDEGHLLIFPHWKEILSQLVLE